MKTIQHITISMFMLFTLLLNTVNAQCTSQGDPTVFGNNAWNVYAWNAGGASDAGTSWNTNYSGYYVDTSLNLNTRWSALGSPSDVSGYNGCPVGIDNHSWSARRLGFPSGYYTINIPSHDDEAQLFVNGANVWQHDGCCDWHANVWTGLLCSSSSVEFRVTEGGGDSYGSISFVLSNPITTSGTVLSCSISSITLSSTLTDTYLWSTGETASSISVNTAGTYTLTATDGVCAGSNFGSVTITSLSAPTATLSGGGCVGVGNISVTNSRTPQKIEWKRNGITVQTDQASYPNAATVHGSASGAYGVCSDDADNIYVADFNNNQILKWTPGSNSPTVVAGGNGQGNAPNQLKHPSGVFVDHSGNIYISDADNYRVQKWAPGASSGVTVAGGNGIGTANNQFQIMYGLCTDNSGNIYVTDWSRIMKWAPGASSGTVVAGGNGFGSAANQLGGVWNVALDNAGNVYAVDYNNSRIQEWMPGATSGITVAGGNGYGSNDNQIGYPRGLIFDKDGNMLINCYYNAHIRRWTPGASSGTYVCGYNGTGSGAVNGASGIAMTSDGTLYTCAQLGGQVVKFAPTINTTFSSPTLADYNVVATTFKGCTVTSNTFTVHSFPTVNITGNAYFCTGGSTTLSAGTHDSYLWSTGGTGQTESFNAAGNYSATVTDFGCSSSKTFYVAEQTPVLNVSSSPSTICMGNTSQLNATLISGGAQNITKVYYIGVNQLLGMGNTCTGNDRYGWYYNVNAGFSFADSGIGNAVAIKLEFNVSAVSDFYSPHQIRINNSTDAVGSFTAPHDYACGIDPANFVNVDLTYINGYAVGGTNSFKTSILNYFGLIRVPALNNYYARVTVQYQILQTSYSWAPSGDTIANPIVTPAATTTYTLTATSLGCVSSPFTTTVTVAPAPGDTSVFGDNAWNVYAFNAGGATDTIHAWRNAYSGYYVDTNLNLNSQSRWNSNSSPSGASGYNGCVVGNDNHSWFAKRQGFPCGTYQINIPGHDDAAQLWVNGVRVWQHIGCCDSHTNVWAGFLDANSTVEFKVTEGSGGSSGRINFILQNLIYKNGPSTICPGYSLQLTAGSAASYLWSTGATTQSINVNASGNYSVDMITNGCTHSASQSVTVAPLDTPIIYSYSNFEFCPINGEGLSITNNARYSSVIWNTGETWTDIYLSSGGNYSVTVSDALGCSATSHATVTGPPGADSTFGNNVWKVNAYLEGDMSDYGYSWLHQDYSGYCTDTSLNFNSQNMWDEYSNPSTASNYQGCQIYDDWMSWSAKRQGFPCGVYQIDILNHDDEGQLFIDGAMVWNHAGCCDNHTNVWTGALTPSSKVEFRVNEGDGASNGALQFTLLNDIPLVNYYVDADSDGYGASTAAPFSSCTDPGAGYVTNNSDCDDGNGNVWQSASLYIDADGDGYDAGSTVVCYGGIIPSGYSATTLGTDCNDANTSVHPGATETCNSIDDNCNGQTDEGVTTTFYADADGDSYGNPNSTTQACSVPSGYVSNTTDCNDGNANVNPFAIEVCNNIDDNCNGQIDEGVTTMFYRDQDADGYGNASATTGACSAPSGYVSNNTDCNDGSNSIHPDATDMCNSVDDNCDGVTDENQVTGVSASTNAPLCIGGTLQLSSNSTNGNSYSWAGPNGYTSSQQNPTIQNVTISATGTYTVTVSNGVAGCSAVATSSATINAATAITTQPASFTGCTGSSTTFSVIASGGNLTYQWQKKGNGNNYNNISGATNSNFTINNLATSNAGIYRVVVNGTCGNATSTTASLTVNLIPTSTASSNSPVCAGKTLNLTSSGGGTYSWSGPNGFSSSVQNPTISNVTTAASGQYTVSVSNGTCTSSATTSVIVNALPVVTASGNSPVCAGSTINLTSSMGSSYSWTGPNGFTSTQRSPNITNATTAASGTYTVTVTNSSGCSATGTTSVIVNPTTAITTQPLSQTVCSGSAATFSVTATGTALTYRWMKGNSNITGATNAAYTISSAASGDAGSYKVVVSGTCGSVTSNTVTLTVNSCNCENATNLSTSSITSSSAIFNWTANVDPQQWQVQYKKSSGGGWTDLLPAGSARSTNVTGLQKNTSYVWHIRAKCNGTWTSYSGNASFTTLAAKEDGQITSSVETKLALYPNPTSGKFIVSLEFAGDVNSEADVQIMNSLGQIIHSNRAAIVNGKLLDEINLERFVPEGNYFVRVIVDDQVYTGQIVIQK